MSVPDLEMFHKRAAVAEEEIALLKEQIESLQQAINANNTEKNSVSKEEYAKLEQENVKLRHRVAILKRTIEADRLKAQGKSGSASSVCAPAVINTYDTLYDIFKKAIAAAYPDVPDVPIVVTTTNNSKFGDYQCNSAMPLARQLSKDVKVTPYEVAQQILSHVEPSPIISKLQLAHPGYINVYLYSSEFVQNYLGNVLKSGKAPVPQVKKQRIIVDFSSPNVAKEMHVGHLRSTIIGDSIARLLEYLGHDVLRLNHIGDWGTQFGMLIAHLQDIFPNYSTVSPPISDLQEFYKESKKRFDECPEFKARAYKCVVKLQAGDPDIVKAWQLICDVSRKEFEKIYSRLDVKLIERGESFYQNYMIELVKDLEKQNLLEEDEGRKIMWGTQQNTGIPFTIIKSDGGFTYDTSDLAALKQRIEEEKAEWIIYVTDAGQAMHFEILKNCAAKAGFLKEHHRIDHVGFGVVLGEDKKKFKTRSGDTVKLTELLDEGLKRSLQKLKEKERDKVLTEEELRTAQESVAYGCIKYADLSHHRNHVYVFSFDKMLEDKGNTAVYLLYALTRIRSIARTANISPERLQELANSTTVSVDHEKEWKLVKILMKFPDVLITITKDFLMHQLCEYCYEVCCAFTEFYDSCYCIEKNNLGEIVKVNEGRILLVEATAIILEQCFAILGLKPVARM